MKNLHEVSEAVKRDKTVCLQRKEVAKGVEIVKAITKNEGRTNPFRAEIFLYEGSDWTEGTYSDEKTLEDAYDVCRSVEYCAETELLEEVEIKPERYLSVGAFFWFGSHCAEVAEVHLSEEEAVTFSVKFTREGETSERVLTPESLLVLAKRAQAISQQNRFASPADFFTKSA